MSTKKDAHDLFSRGSCWIRADFHLHTRVDGEFSYAGEENAYISSYIEGLKAGDIRLGVITNHNKFDKDEFVALRKHARREEIYLLPGVELSVNDGANGVHMLVVFSDEWLAKGQDYISPAISAMFPGKAEVEFQRENGRSDKNILAVVDKLETFSKDYFLIFAHVERDNGLWKSMQGGKLGDFSTPRYEKVRSRTLAFQQVRTRDERKKVKEWLKGWYPAEVEGADPKEISHIGRGNTSYIKLGAFSFEALKFALLDSESRTAPEPPAHTSSHIRSMRFEGGTLSGTTLHFSRELNTLIGIRGSGKSSILEVLRYVLEIPFGEKAGDTEYKNKLVEYTLGSGGKVEVEVVDRYGRDYTIRRILGAPASEVLMEGELRPGVSIQETVLHKPIYFGQKDLSASGEGFEKDLVEKLLGSKLDEVRRRIVAQKAVVGEAVERLQKVSNVQEDIAEQQKIVLDTKHQLQLYADHGVEEKLQKQLDFASDAKTIKTAIESADAFLADLRELLADHEDDLKNIAAYTSKQNGKLFTRFFAEYKAFVALVDRIKTDLDSLSSRKTILTALQEELQQASRGMAEEFAEVERRLAEELKQSGRPNINSGEFKTLKKRLSDAEQMIAVLEKEGARKKELEDGLLKELSILDELMHEEFMLIKTELDKIGEADSSLSISSEYKQDKQAFLQFMKETFAGSSIRQTTYQAIVDEYPDFIAIYRDFENAQKLFGSNPQLYSERFFANLKTLLTYQTPHKFTISYRGKELRHHSLGQRASALILFVLSRRENDLVIIDQPEDDLDNQTIYEDVIKLIRKMKSTVQFLFATHNPNIPVLGDAEQVLACSFMDDTVTVASGSVDDPETQKNIVGIMEGGREAFNRRKEIYRIWNP